MVKYNELINGKEIRRWLNGKNIGMKKLNKRIENRLENNGSK
jgi:hypothetical protein